MSPAPQSPADLDHPTPGHLADFGLGRLAPDHSAAVERHVCGCTDCSAALGQLPDDGLVRALRASAAGPPVAGGPEMDLADHPRYQLLDRLGGGGMGVVFRARHRLMDRQVALKVLHPRLVARPGAVERFRREARAAARLSHPNIVTAHDADQAGSSHFLVMEYVEGESLDRLVERRGRLPVAEACEYARQAAVGLQHAHDRGMVHRDVKPQNLMLTPAGQVKILDFGLAQMTTDMPLDTADTAPGLAADATTRVSTLLGTPDYIAPEQSADPHGADGRADVYGLGGTLYFLLTGRPPYPGGTAADKLAARKLAAPVPITNLRPDVPAALARLVGRMLDPDPSRRPPTAASVGRALAPFARGSRRRKTILVAGAVVVAAATVLTPILNHRPPAGPVENRRFLGHAGPVKGLAFLPDGGRLLSGGDDGTLRLWDVATGDEQWRLSGHDKQIHGIALSHDGRRAATAGADGTVRVWDAEQAQPLGTFTGHEGQVWCVAFTPEADRVLSGGADKTIRLWDVSAGREVRRFEGHTHWVFGVDVAPDGREAVSGGWDGTVRLWDLVGDRPARRCTGSGLDAGTAHGLPVRSVAFSPNGRQVLSGSYAMNLRLWDRASAAELFALAGPAGAVHGVAFSRDGRRAVSGGWDETVRIWDLAAGRELYRIDGIKSKVESVAFAPDGRHVAAGAWDGVIRLWRLPEE